MKPDFINIIYNLKTYTSETTGNIKPEFQKCILFNRTLNAPMTPEEIDTIVKDQTIYLKNVENDDTFYTTFNLENVFMPYSTKLYRAMYSNSFSGQIPPAMPCHADDLNPRSCVLIDGNDNVFFMQVEGREFDNGGIGLDLFQLAEIAKNMGAVNVINLDGGGSAFMSWKETGINVASTTDFVSASLFIFFHSPE